MKWLYLDNLSTTKKMLVFPLEWGRASMKSIKMLVHTCKGMDGELLLELHFQPFVFDKYYTVWWILLFFFSFLHNKILISPSAKSCSTFHVCFNVFYLKLQALKINLLTNKFYSEIKNSILIFPGPYSFPLFKQFTNCSKIELLRTSSWMDLSQSGIEAEIS